MSRLAVSLLVLCACIRAQTGFATVEGQILDQITGAPLRKAEVRLWVRAAKFTFLFSTSDEAGRFSFPNLAAGSYSLSAERNGYLWMAYGARRSSREGSIFELTAGQKLTATIRLSPQAAISGRVVDEDGDPLSAMLVDLFQLRYTDGRRQMEKAGSTSSTDDRGRYRIADLPQGQYYLRVMPPESTQRRDERYVPTFYPGTIAAASASPIDLTAGTELENVSLKLAKRPTVRVSGRVTVQGSSSPDVSVSLEPMDTVHPHFVPRPQPAMGPGGAFEFTGVLPGTYNLYARNQQGWARRTIEVGRSNVPELSISIPAGAVLTGRMTIDGETSANLSAVRVVLAAAYPNTAVYSTASSALSQERTFRIGAMAHDRYRIDVVELPQGLYVKTIRLGGTGLPGRIVELAGTTEIEVILGTRPATISGKVTPGAKIIAIPNDKAREGDWAYHRSAVAGASGDFTLGHLIPAAYTVYAWEDPDDADIDPELIAKHAGAGVSVSAAEGSHQTVSLKPIPADAR